MTPSTTQSATSGTAGGSRSRTSGSRSTGRWARVAGSRRAINSHPLSDPLPQHLAHPCPVIWPDGRQEIFDLTPQDGSTLFAPLIRGRLHAAALARPRRSCRRDTRCRSSATATCTAVASARAASMTRSASALPPTTAPSTCSIGLGLVSATDRLGNTLTVRPRGQVVARPSIVFDARLPRPDHGISRRGPRARRSIYGYDASGA